MNLFEQMFGKVEWLEFFRKNCSCCGVQLPRGFKAVDGGYCSEKCSRIDDELMELLHNAMYSVQNMNHMDQRRVSNLREELEENYHKMEKQFK